MAIEMFGLAIAIVLFDLLGISVGYPYIEEYFSSGIQVVAVDRQTSASMVGCVYDLEDVAADQLIISIDGHQNLPLLAVLVNSIIKVGHMVLPVVIFNQSNLLPNLWIALDLLL